MNCHQEFPVEFFLIRTPGKLIDVGSFMVLLLWGGLSVIAVLHPISERLNGVVAPDHCP